MHTEESPAERAGALRPRGSRCRRTSDASPLAVHQCGMRAVPGPRVATMWEVGQDSQGPTPSADVDLFAAAPDGIVVVNERARSLPRTISSGRCSATPPASSSASLSRALLPDRFRAGHARIARPTSRRRHAARWARRYDSPAAQANGEEFPVDISLNYERGPRWLASCDRVRARHHRRHRLEEELRATEENFRLLVEGVADHALIMLDPSGRVVTWNPGAERIKGWAAAEIIGRDFCGVLPSRGRRVRPAGT